MYLPLIYNTALTHRNCVFHWTRNILWSLPHHLRITCLYAMQIRHLREYDTEKKMFHSDCEDILAHIGIFFSISQFFWNYCAKSSFLFSIIFLQSSHILASVLKSKRNSDTDNSDGNFQTPFNQIAVNTPSSSTGSLEMVVDNEGNFFLNTDICI